MANFEAIKAAIDAVIKTNGRQEITGEVMNGVLNGMVDAVNEKKQDTLVSGETVKTINGQSILGEGDIIIEGGEEYDDTEIREALAEVESSLADKQDKEAGKGLSTNDFTNADKTLLEGVAKQGVISQTQTWTQASDGGYDYVMSDLVRGWIPQANIDLFVSAGAVFNEESGYFELNGLTDISYEEMREIHSRSYMFKGRLNFDAYNIGTARTLYPIENQSSYLDTQIRLNWMANFCTNPLEVIVINITKQSLLVLSSLGYGGKVIKIQANPAISADRWESTTCQYSNYFQYVELTGLARNISFSSNPAFSTDSILYMINNEAASSAITITLHATAYARAMADTRITSALETHTNITLASA